MTSQGRQTKLPLLCICVPSDGGTSGVESGRACLLIVIGGWESDGSARTNPVWRAHGATRDPVSWKVFQKPSRISGGNACWLGWTSRGRSDHLHSTPPSVLSCIAPLQPCKQPRTTDFARSSPLSRGPQPDRGGRGSPEEPKHGRGDAENGVVQDYTRACESPGRTETATARLFPSVASRRA